MVPLPGSMASKGGLLVRVPPSGISSRRGNDEDEDDDENEESFADYGDANDDAFLACLSSEDSLSSTNFAESGEFSLTGSLLYDSTSYLVEESFSESLVKARKQRMYPDFNDSSLVYSLLYENQQNRTYTSKKPTTTTLRTNAGLLHKVKFHEIVSVREYAVTVGALCATVDACPIQLSWEYEQYTIRENQYEIESSSLHRRLKHASQRFANKSSSNNNDTERIYTNLASNLDDSFGVDSLLACDYTATGEIKSSSAKTTKGSKYPRRLNSKERRARIATVQGLTTRQVILLESQRKLDALDAGESSIACLPSRLEDDDDESSSSETNELNDDSCIDERQQPKTCHHSLGYDLPDQIHKQISRWDPDAAAKDRHPRALLSIKSLSSSSSSLT